MRLQEFLLKRRGFLEKIEVINAIIEILESDFLPSDASPEPPKRIQVPGTLDIVSDSSIYEVIEDLNRLKKEYEQNVEQLDSEEISAKSVRKANKRSK